MRIPRIFDENVANAKVGDTVRLNDFGAQHVSKVLRMKEGEVISVFDGAGHEFDATITSSKKIVEVKLERVRDHNVESPLNVELLQVVSRGDRMDFTIQKAVELGITRIIPLMSERCGVKLDKERAQKKVESYQKIAIAACEQCGRNVVPKVESIIDIRDYFASKMSEGKATPDNLLDRDGFLNLTLDPYSQSHIADFGEQKNFRLLIGPEGGFSDDEVKMSLEAHFVGVNLGPRILRTETAALVALSILGASYGDL